jgi:hypothetical protein
MLIGICVDWIRAKIAALFNLKVLSEKIAMKINFMVTKIAVKVQ